MDIVVASVISVDTFTIYSLCNLRGHPYSLNGCADDVKKNTMRRFHWSDLEIVTELPPEILQTEILPVIIYMTMGCVLRGQVETCLLTSFVF